MFSFCLITYLINFAQIDFFFYISILRRFYLFKYKGIKYASSKAYPTDADDEIQKSY